MAVTVFYGQHRSKALAERHARDYEREHGGVVEIVARRNGDGQFSTRGHFFTFQHTPEEEEEPEEPEEQFFEWLVSWTYANTKKTLDFITVAANEDDATEQSKDFIAAIKQTRSIAASGFHNWKSRVKLRIARAKPVSPARDGETKYREPGK